MYTLQESGGTKLRSLAELMNPAMVEEQTAPAYAGLLSLLASQPEQGGGNGGSPGGGLGQLANLSPHQQALRIAKWIEKKPGFEVGGLHGWQGQGGISSGHIDNSQHYGKGFAGDVNYVGGGKFPDEKAALDWLVRRANRKFGGLLTEDIWQEPDHYDHWHYGTRPGG